MTIINMSPEIRVKNSYESLYYCIDSNDPEADEILREQIQKAFVDHDLLLSDRPSQKKLHEVMLDAYKESMKQLGGTEPTELEIQAFTKEFNRFTKEHQDFYDVSFRRFEEKYLGDSVDLPAEYERTVRDHDGISSIVAGQTNEAAEVVEAGSKISYLGHVSQASVPIARYHYEPAASKLTRSHVDEPELKPNRQYAVNNQELESNGPEI
ncbi:hypothetical protein [Paenibacillus glucanolyticus]|uniref:hypothetical protein n=1 Tax=Paenibacillus glucanolyticus TaxID=59843 RepID=UPI00096DF70E|nr:hypothetical protein [Paenibacillus glucanolyticus]OMF76790.1 hypothetical protein BK142_14825 [Paenibacillus glucanolyticus]